MTGFGALACEGIRRLTPFAWTGRMALTNYMTQIGASERQATAPRFMGLTLVTF